MARETRIVNGRMFEVSKIYRNDKETGKKYEAFVFVPLCPEVKSEVDKSGAKTGKTVPFNEDDYADWIASCVEDGTLTWKQVVLWTLKQIPILAGGPAFKTLSKKDKTKFDSQDLLKIYSFLDRAKEALGPKQDDPALLLEAMQEMYLQSLRSDNSDWKAEEHVVMPKDI